MLENERDRQEKDQSMYETDREVLHLVKMELYEISTKVITNSIEMYTDMNLTDWVQNVLTKKLDEREDNKGLLRFKADFADGKISGIDITNGCYVIEKFVRNDAKQQAVARVEQRKNKLEEDLDKIRKEKEPEKGKEDQEFLEAWQEEESELEKNERAVIDQEDELAKLQKKKGNKLEIQNKKESDAMDALREARNKNFAHSNEDESEISKVESWVPNADELFEWARKILNYLQVIEERYKIYALFDDNYFQKKRKDKFDSCKVSVQKQIKRLLANQSKVCFEFGGDIYSKDDSDYSFGRLIERMGERWDTGIRYLTLVTNEDMPELNLFFRECLSGTDQYVDDYLACRNELRNAYKEKSKQVDAIYFDLLYRLNNKMENIYWRGKQYTKQEFAYEVLFPCVTATSVQQLEKRLNRFDDFMDGLDPKIWCENHLLSRSYFGQKGDATGSKFALKMENALLGFWNTTGEEQEQFFRSILKNAVLLYFYMKENYLFAVKRSKEETLYWNYLSNAKKYLEESEHFASFDELYDFVNELGQSVYFKIWAMQGIDRTVTKEAEDTKQEYSGRIPQYDVHFYYGFPKPVEATADQEEKCQWIIAFYEQIGARHSKNKWLYKTGEGK